MPIDYDWGNDEASKSLLPVSAPEGVALAPLGVLNVVRCCSATDQLFANASSMCATAQMPCTIVGGCHVVEDCCNRLTKQVSATEYDLDSGNDDADLGDGRNVLNKLLCIKCR